MLSAAAAQSYAALALACIEREYPNAPAHVLLCARDAKTPKQLHPAFYGCFDWHSAVHAHWCLARLARVFPRAEFSARARSALARGLTAPKLAAENAYLSARGREGFERPYGLAWLLALAAELRMAGGAHSRAWSQALRPLERTAVKRVGSWLAKLSYPVRSGVHSQTAFSLGLMLDYARQARAEQFRRMLESKAAAFYLRDADGPLRFEPSGEDFLSPCLAQADVMRRILRPTAFAVWLARFLPSIPDGGRRRSTAPWLQPAAVSDPSDGRLAHLAGLNLSRAWMLRAIAAALPANDGRIAAMQAAAEQHRLAGLRFVNAKHYAGSHWLASYAVYLETLELKP
jgi:hypothetical protein